MYKNLITANNLIWSLMYFDHVEIKDNYQITSLGITNSDFYNAAHTYGKLNSDDLCEIDRYFSNLGVKYGVYITPETPESTIFLLRNAGFIEYSEFNLDWHYIELDSVLIRQINSMDFTPSILANDIEIIEINSENSSQYLDQFVLINNLVNSLGDAVAYSFREKVIKNIVSQSNNHLFLGFYKKKPAFIGSVGIINGFAALAEGGTLASFRLKGLHSEMVRYRLNVSYKLGANKCFYSANPSAKSKLTAEKIGMKKLFTSTFYRKIT